MNRSVIQKQLSVCDTLDALAHETRGLLTNYRLTDFIFFRTKRAWKSEGSRGMLTSLPKQWYREYVREKLYQYDVISGYAENNSSPVFSYHLYHYIDNAPFSISLTQKNRQIIRLNSRFGINDFYCIPQNAINGAGKVILMLAARNVETDEFQSIANDAAIEMNDLCSVLDRITTHQFDQFFIGECDRSYQVPPKALRCLIALANADCTIAELAQQLHISPVTAQAQLAEARKALGVKTTIAAIAKAKKLGMLDYI